jgi:fucose permease
MFLGQFLSPLYSQPLVERIGLAATFAVTAGAVAAGALVFFAIAALKSRSSP